MRYDIYRPTCIYVAMEKNDGFELPIFDPIFKPIDILQISCKCLNIRAMKMSEMKRKRKQKSRLTWEKFGLLYWACHDHFIFKSLFV